MSRRADLERMNRRGFLATAGAVVVAGCSGGEGNSTPTSSGADEPGSGPEEPTPGPDAEAAIGRLTDGPSVVECQHVPLTVSSYGRRIRVPDRLSAVASFVEPATGDTPARLEAVFTNGTEYEQTVRAGAFPILDDPSLGRTEGGEHRVAYLAPTEAHELAESVPTPERDGEGRWRLGDDGLSGRWFPETVTIGPESAVFGEYVLLGHPDRSEPPVSPGRYRLGSRNAEFTVAVWRTDAPGPENGSRFEGESVPPLPSAESGPMRWYHEADTGTAAYLEPSAERVSTPAEVRFRQVNHADESLQGNPYKWALSKLVGGEWLRVAPWETPQPWSVVQPGAVDLSGLRLFHGSGFDGVDGADTGGARTVPYVGGGSSTSSCRGAGTVGCGTRSRSSRRASSGWSYGPTGAPRSGRSGSRAAAAGRSATRARPSRSSEPSTTANCEEGRLPCLARGPRAFATAITASTSRTRAGLTASSEQRSRRDECPASTGRPGGRHSVRGLEGW